MRPVPLTSPVSVKGTVTLNWPPKGCDWLLWNQAANGSGEIVVEYEDRSEGIAYVLYPPRDRALDAFYHPNAYLQPEHEQAA